MNVNQAVSVLHSWLQAVGVDSVSEGKDCLFLHPYSDAEILVSVSPDGRGDLCIDGAKLLSTDQPEALAEFHKVTQFIGMGRPSPLIREPSEGRSKDFDLTVMRHCEFRNAPNPSDADIKKYERVVDNCVKRFFVSNKSICGYSYLDEDDLKSYAMVWLCNFIHKYQLFGVPDVENFKLLNYHIQQRFYKFRSDLYRRQKSIRPDEQAAALSLGDGGIERMEWAGEDEGEAIPAMRRSDACETLAKRLSELPHDKMIYLLQEIAESTDYRHADDTKKAAAKYLEAHQSTACQECYLALQREE